MPISYTDLQPTDKIKDMYPKVNALGNYLKNNVNTNDVKTIANPDFNNITATVFESGTYYATTAYNAPPNANYNGFFTFVRRGVNYYTIYYSPFNSNDIYIKTCSNGSLLPWEKIKLDTSDFYEYGKTLDVTMLKGSTIQYANVINPPDSSLSEGWVDYKENTQGLGVVEYSPINSESIYKKMQKMPEQTQNPNILEDSLFKTDMASYGNITTTTSPAKWGSYLSLFNPDTSHTFQGQNTVVVKSDGKSSYPTVQSKPYVIGQDVRVGDTLTFSVYAKVTDVSKANLSNPYLDVACYDTLTQSSNPTIGQVRISSSNARSGEWKRFQITVQVPTYTTEDKPAKYLRVLLRMDCSNNVNSGAEVFYALPKLEKSSTSTPFITNTNDAYSFDEIWTKWMEYQTSDELNKHVPSDILNNGYFDYLWGNPEAVQGKTFKDLVNTVPQGLHTFYCNHAIPGAPTDKAPVRGTILIDHEANNPDNVKRGVIQCIDSTGKMYVYYKHDDNLTTTSQLQGATFLWEGKLDLADTNTTVPLAEDLSKFDYIDISYTVKFNGTDQTDRYFMGAGISSFVIREFNLSDTGGAGVDFWEGALKFTGKTLKPARSVKVSYSTSTNTTSAYPLNTKGEIFIYKVVGIKSI